MKYYKGFTLIEVLVVIAVIAIIIAVLLPNFNQLRITSRDQARKTGVKALVEALELYKLNQNPPSYPDEITNLNIGQSWQEGGITYLNQTPVDPLYATVPTEYFYRYSRQTATTYYLGVCLENEADSDGRSSPNQVIFDDNTCDSNLWYYKTEP